MMKPKLLFLLAFLLFSGFLQAQIVNIPDPHFKQALLHPQSIGDGDPMNPTIDTNNDGEIEYGEAEAITHLNLFNGTLNGVSGNITDLTGIEAFTNLTYLDASYNQLSTLNLTSNTALDTLYCSNNQLTDLNITNNQSLLLLWCGENHLSTIDISENINLTDLQIWNNQLNDLNIETNLNLETLACENNQIDSLDITIIPDLNVLNCKNNNLIYLNLKNGNNINFLTMSAKENPNITCLYVDDKNYSENAPNWQKDATAHYVETETECETFGVNDYNFQPVKIYPNPVQDKLHIKAKQPLDNIQLFDLQGKRLDFKMYSPTKQSLDLSSFPSGIYFLQITVQNQLSTRKIIKL